VTSFIFCLLFRKQFTLAPEVAVIVVGGLTVILLIVVGWIDCDPENPAAEVLLIVVGNPAAEVLLIVVGWIDRDPENLAEVLLIVVVGWIDRDPENPAEVLHLHLFSVLFFFLHHAGDFSYYSYSWTVASVGTLFINLDPLLLLLS
jgi:hypothetical protein